MFDDDEEGDPIRPLDVDEEALRMERERARARGEKRVYFSDVTSPEDEEGDEDDAYDGIIQDPEDDRRPCAARRPALEPSRSSSGVDEFFDADEGDDDDRSFYTDADEQSMYSRYSVVEPERNTSARERFMKRIESVYNNSVTHGGVDDIPDVPELPKSLRDAVPAALSSSNLLPDRRGTLKTSNPGYF